MKKRKKNKSKGIKWTTLKFVGVPIILDEEKDIEKRPTYLTKLMKNTYKKNKNRLVPL